MTTVMNEKQRLMVESATAFAADRLYGMAAELDHSRVFPKDVVSQLAAKGALGILVPEAYGGGNLGFATYVDVVQALSRACAAIASILNHHALTTSILTDWGSDALKNRILPALAKGDRLATFALAETGPGVGIGPDALIATRKGEKFLLKGSKAFVRNAGVADTYLVFATLTDPPGAKGLAAFIVQAEAPGLTVGPVLETMGLNGCPVAHIRFNDVSVAQDAILHELGAGSAIAEQLLHLFAVAEGAQTVGIAQSAATHAATYARHRVQFHHPIAHQEAIQTMLAGMATDSQLAWLGVQRAATLIDAGEPFEVAAAMVKSFLARFGSRIMIDGCQVEGGLGISESAPKGIREALPLARLFRDIAGTTLLDAPGDFPDRLIAASLVA